MADSGPKLIQVIDIVNLSQELACLLEDMITLQCLEDKEETRKKCWEKSKVS